MADYYLNSFRVSSEFGESRANGGHNAVDFAGKTAGAALGMNIPNIVSGKVIEIYKNNKTAGNGVTIQGDDGRIYRYIHMQFPPSLKQGQTVKQGQSLGKIGSTGRSTGPHLDLRVTDKNGKLMDAMTILKGMSSTSPANTGKSVVEKNPMDLSMSSLSKTSNKSSGSSGNYGAGSSGYKGPYKKISQATKAPGYQTYKSNLSKAVDNGKISAAWAYDLTELIGRESTWNSKAKNPTSSAYGYGQLIKANVAPYEKKTGVKYSDPYGQIIITAQYIKDRYGTPKKALEFHNKNGWY